MLTQEEILQRMIEASTLIGSRVIGNYIIVNRSTADLLKSIEKQEIRKQKFKILLDKK